MIVAEVVVAVAVGIGEVVVAEDGEITVEAGVAGVETMAGEAVVDMVVVTKTPWATCHESRSKSAIYSERNALAEFMRF